MPMFDSLAPSNYGTTLDGLTVLGTDIGLIEPINSALATTCTACVQQEKVGVPGQAERHADRGRGELHGHRDQGR